MTILRCFIHKISFLLADGKICLDVLQMPPGGSYNPAITLESILLSIQLLLACPNADDPLRNDVSDEYKYNRDLFNQNAKKYSGNTKDTNEIDESKSMDEDQPLQLDNDDDDDADANADDGGDVKNKTLPKSDNGETNKETAPTTSKVNRKRKHDNS